MRPIQKLRILLDANDSLRRFYWFECRGDDVYWGFSGPHVSTDGVAFSGSTLDLERASWVTSDVSHAKASFHESGQFHVERIDSSGRRSLESRMNWRPTHRLNQPFRLMTLITKAPVSYEAFSGSPTRGRSHAAIVKVENPHVRHYVEFYLSPEGEFLRPTPLFASSEVVADAPLLTQSLSEKLILVVRMLAFRPEHPLNAWKPDRQLEVYTEDQDWDREQ